MAANTTKKSRSAPTNIKARIAAAQSKKNKVQEERERVKREEEEHQAKLEEERKRKLEEQKNKEEEIARLKKEGKLLSVKQQKKAQKDKEFIKQLAAQKILAPEENIGLNKDVELLSKMILKGKGEETKKPLKVESSSRSRILGSKLKKYQTPIICILGHVDSGKTSFIDSLRGKQTQKSEAGGITQAVSSFFISIETLQEDFLLNKTTLKDLLPNKSLEELEERAQELDGLVVIDTPGHESFSAMRKSGAHFADLAFLVVDVNKGVEPQTAESLRVLRKSKVPYVVLANKIDTLVTGLLPKEPYSSIFKSKKGAFVNKIKDLQTSFSKEEINLRWMGINRAQGVPFSAEYLVPLELQEAENITPLTADEESSVDALPISAILGVGMAEAMAYLLLNLKLEENPNPSMIHSIYESWRSSPAIDRAALIKGSGEDSSDALSSMDLYVLESGPDSVFGNEVVCILKKGALCFDRKTVLFGVVGKEVEEIRPRKVVDLKDGVFQERERGLVFANTSLVLQVQGTSEKKVNVRPGSFISYSREDCERRNREVLEPSKKRGKKKGAKDKKGNPGKGKKTEKETQEHKKKKVAIFADTENSLLALASFVKTSSKDSVCPLKAASKTVASSLSLLDVKTAKSSAVFAVLVFNSKVPSEVSKLAKELELPLFRSNVIYSLLDSVWEYNKLTLEERLKSTQLVYPCVLRVVPKCVFRTKNPILLGVEVLKGVLMEGVSLVGITDIAGVEGEEGLKLPRHGKHFEVGKVVGIEKDKKNVKKVLEGEKVCVKIESDLTVGRSIGEKSMFVSKVNKLDISNFRDKVDLGDIDKSLWKFMETVKEFFGIV